MFNTKKKPFTDPEFDTYDLTLFYDVPKDGFEWRRPNVSIYVLNLLKL